MDFLGETDHFIHALKEGLKSLVGGLELRGMDAETRESSEGLDTRNFTQVHISTTTDRNSLLLSRDSRDRHVSMSTLNGRSKSAAKTTTQQYCVPVLNRKNPSTTKDIPAVLPKCTYASHSCATMFPARPTSAIPGSICSRRPCNVWQPQPHPSLDLTHRN